jgi:hypothetical protein
MKFNDINCIGFKDAGDNGLFGWTIVLSDDVGATYITTTAADSSYSFGNLPAGTSRSVKSPKEDGLLRHNRVDYSTEYQFPQDGM